MQLARPSFVPLFRACVIAGRKTRRLHPLHLHDDPHLNQALGLPQSRMVRR
jgi:hypothetical protein